MKATSILRITLYILVIVVPTSSWGALFTVTNTNDSGEGSLRQAVSTAVISSGDDTILFDPSLTGQTIFLTSGAVNIGDRDQSASGVIAINGLGAKNLTISGSNNSGAFTLGDESQLVIDGLKITDTTPYAIEQPVSSDPPDERLTLINCIITNNHSVKGFRRHAAIYGFVDVVVDNCDISSNNSLAMFISNGSIKLLNSTITNNSATAILGGFGQNGNDNGGIDIFVEDSIVSNNRGEGIDANEGSLKLLNSTVSSNDLSAVSNSSSGRTEIIGSTLANNGQGIHYTGAKHNEDSGNSTGTLTVINSTISGNFTPDSGGGIYVENHQEENSIDGPVELTITLTNTTITDNSAATQGGGIMIVPDQGI
jgi:hypothetical protein